MSGNNPPWLFLNYLEIRYITAEGGKDTQTLIDIWAFDPNAEYEDED